MGDIATSRWTGGTSAAEEEADDDEEDEDDAEDDDLEDPTTATRPNRKLLMHTLGLWLAWG
ncbi:hypothetical protein THAOC_21143, partial [Thalassiosira oceanica]